jgi:hypothetical protein
MSKAEQIYEKVRLLSEPDQSAVLQIVQDLSSQSNGQTSDRTKLESLFQNLAAKWRKETAFFSFTQQRVLHPAYQRIIGLGWPAVPLILRDLQQKPEHWFWALQAITGEAPAREGSTFQTAVEAWLGWGRERGLLNHAS